MTGIVIQSLAGLMWTLAYILIILRSRRDKVYGVPLVALSANLTWEFWYTLVELPPHEDPVKLAAQFVVNFVWLVFDLVILAQTLRYGPRQFDWLPRAGFYAMFALVLAVTGPTIVLLNKEFDDVFGVRASFVQNLVMSGLFLAMLNARRSAAGQSLGIALSKMAGTGLAALGVFLYPPAPVYDHSVLLPFLYVAILVVDGVYTAGMWRLRDVPAPAAPVVEKVAA
ncbi:MULTISPECIES: hypothetical protein [Actinomadura]|uniref:Uncharacterized protein n=1 Tax=Actinomadura yumaensis TaxID=111807 RepID=A0ABW2CV86_9ACTN|nr:hypothetical protein [Actinomadura sp. J1-007]MWK39155.1 hypothetical protein [Actinomadura sp. J1-007]